MTDSFSLSGFDRIVGLALTECSGERVVGFVALRDELLQPHGLAHGGLYATIAETLASEGTNAGVRDRRMVGLGANNNTTFLRPISLGSVHATAVPRHRGGSTWVWDVECSDDGGRLCAISRVTVAVRPAPARN